MSDLPSEVWIELDQWNVLHVWRSYGHTSHRYVLAGDRPPWCQWCDDIGHDEADCPDYESPEAQDDPREVAAENAIDEGYGRGRA